MKKIAIVLILILLGVGVYLTYGQIQTRNNKAQVVEENEFNGDGTRRPLMDAMTIPGASYTIPWPADPCADEKIAWDNARALVARIEAELRIAKARRPVTKATIKNIAAVEVRLATARRAAQQDKEIYDRCKAQQVSAQ